MKRGINIKEDDSLSFKNCVICGGQLFTNDPLNTCSEHCDNLFYLYEERFLRDRYIIAGTKENGKVDFFSKWCIKRFEKSINELESIIVASGNRIPQSNFPHIDNIASGGSEFHSLLNEGTSNPDVGDMDIQYNKSDRKPQNVDFDDFPEIPDLSSFFSDSNNENELLHQNSYSWQDSNTSPSPHTNNSSSRQSSGGSGRSGGSINGNTTWSGSAPQSTSRNTSRSNTSRSSGGSSSSSSSGVGRQNKTEKYLWDHSILCENCQTPLDISKNKRFCRMECWHEWKRGKPRDMW